MPYETRLSLGIKYIHKVVKRYEDKVKSTLKAI